MSTDTTLISALVQDIISIADDIVNELEPTTSVHPRGTVLKALPTQTRFKSKSMWVSLGNGKYQHLTGSKGLITSAERLDGYTEVVFQA